MHMRLDFDPPVLAGSAETSEVAVSGTNRREFDVVRELVVGMLTFLFCAHHAESVRVEVAHCSAAFEGCATTVAPFLVEEFVHFQSSLGLVVSSTTLRSHHSDIL